MIKAEHKELLAQLVDELENKDLHGVAEHFEALDALTLKLCQAMDGQYTVDDLPEVAAAFDELVTSGDGICDSIVARFWRISDAALDDMITEVNTWAEANQAEIWTDFCNWSSPRCTRFETFAATLADRIERCISGWKYSHSETEIDEPSQWFYFFK